MSVPCFGRVATSTSLYHWKAFTNLGSLPQQIYRWPNWTKDGQLLNFRVVKHQRKKYRRDMLHHFASSYVKLKRLGQELDIWHMIAHDQWSRFHLSRIFSAFEALEQRHRWKERIYIEMGQGWLVHTMTWEMFQMFARWWFSKVCFLLDFAK